MQIFKLPVASSLGILWVAIGFPKLVSAIERNGYQLLSYFQYRIYESGLVSGCQ